LKTEKEKIIISSIGLFVKNGFSKTSMDDIAQSLKMSKKTLYKHFTSKNVLLKQSVLYFMDFNNNKMQEIISSNDNAIVKAYNIFHFIGSVLLNLSENFLIDIKTLEPDLWKLIDKIRTKYINQNLTKIIDQGKEEGYFIKEPTFLIINTFISVIRGNVNPNVVLQKKISIEESFKGSIKILMQGILTSKGKKVFKSLNIGETK